MHSGWWEKVVDALFWLQLTWIFSGFLLMAYFALKVFPTDKKAKNSHSDSAVPTSQRPELITLGNYRFEIAADKLTSQAKIIELYTQHTERDPGLQ